MPATSEPRPGARWISVNQAAALLSLHPMTIRSMINRGIVPACHLGRAVRVDALKLEAQLEGQAQGQRT